MLNRKIKVMGSLLVMTTMTAGLMTGCGEDKKQTQAADAQPKVETSKEASKESKAETSKEAKTEGYTGNMVVSIHDELNNPAAVEALDYLQKQDKWKNVKFEIMPKDQEYEINLPIQVMGGKQIDVMYNFNPIQQDKNATAGTILPIGQYLEELGINVEERYGSFASACYNNGEVYGIPGGVTAWGLFYNKSIFDEAGIAYPDPKVPMTWSEYRELAKKLTKGEGANKTYGTLNLQWPMYWYGEAIMKLGGGQHFYNAEGLSNFDDPAFKEALEATYKMQNVDKSTPTMADIIARKIEPDGFFNGKYAMYLHGTWFLNWLADKETYPRDYEVGFAPMPIPDGTTKRQTWGVTATFAVPATSKDPKMATDFIVDLVAEITKRTSSEIFVDTTVPHDNLFVSIADDIKDEQFTTENLTDLFLSPDQVSVTEKVSGPNAAKYEAVIKEEVEKYFADAQDIDTTIKNVLKRGNKAIQD